MLGRIVIWAGLTMVALAFLLAGAFHVRATTWDVPHETYHCGTLLAPNIFPNSTRENYGNAMLLNDDCETARNLRAEWATAVGVLGLATIGVGVGLGARRRAATNPSEN